MSKEIELITSADMAMMLHINPRTLENWRSMGLGPNYVKLGKKAFYTAESFNKYVAANIVKTSNG